MSFKFFTVPIQDAERIEAEINRFLRSHKVLFVDRRWVDQGVSSFWSFCIEYLDAVQAGANAGREGSGQRSRIDYKEVLSAEDFAVFAELRTLRKNLSEQDGVPAYALFTNEQLAEFVQTRASTKAALKEIPGVGDAKIAKYGEAFLSVLHAAFLNGHPDEPVP